MKNRKKVCPKSKNKKLTKQSKFNRQTFESIMIEIAAIEEAEKQGIDIQEAIDEFRCESPKAGKTKIEHRDEQIMRVLQKIQEAGKSSPDLLHEKYQDSDRSRLILNGLCYVMSECMYHLFSDKFIPYRILWNDGGTHWFLKLQDGTIIDTIAPNGREACSPKDYARAERKDFYSKRLSKRARILLERAGLKI
ncbi:hypothetical protein U27_04958 [Candidatus Vecturithrix granuli]|uniref:Uncharacterized protein n=1 Tax=Vecturithrix granuli TaxID=1499967 RepID=A0A081C080_VECG1|nr:hypothetical protein U27_04958 [Candidatus Vecturithrix granuli]